MVDTCPSSHRPDYIARPNEPEDYFSTVQADLRYFHATRSKQHYLPYGIAFEVYCLTAQEFHVVSSGNNLPAVCRRDVREQRKPSNQLCSMPDCVSVGKAGSSYAHRHSLCHGLLSRHRFHPLS